MLPGATGGRSARPRGRKRPPRLPTSCGPSFSFDEAGTFLESPDFAFSWAIGTRRR